MAAGVRVDKWLWSVRICKTRTLATKACDTGRVTINGTEAKAAKRVVPGDRVVARLKEREVVVEVVELHEKRIGAAVAVAAYVDHSVVVASPSSFGAEFAVRARGAGRPTKRDRRDIDRLKETRQDDA